jgi:adenosylmethionine-8-amino-7-oxononanoate aminotransferase
MTLTQQQKEEGLPPATALVDLDRRHLIHPNLHHDDGERTVFVRGAGSKLWDATGREFLDATGGLWLNQIGHGRTSMAEAAARQVSTLEYFTSFWHFSNDQSITLAAKLADLAPGALNRVFFTSGGSEGNDTALKAARFYHHRRGQRQRTWVLSRRYAYHGVAYGSGSLTGFDVFHEGFGPHVPDIFHLTPPYPYRAELYDEQDPTDFLVDELKQTIERLGPDRIAAMIGEPIMGVAGVVIPPQDYWRRVREVLDEHGILLIADEVITGFGRAGAWFASEVEGMRPDLMVIAKGITSGYAPLGAVLMTDEVGETIAAGEGFSHGYTYFGHPVCCALALENLDILAREELVDRAAEMGSKLIAMLAPAKDLPIVGELRGRGLMIALELVKNRESREPFVEGAFEAAMRIQHDHSVIVRDSGHVIGMSPPLVIDDEQARRVADAVLETLTSIAAEQPDDR